MNPPGPDPNLENNVPASVEPTVDPSSGGDVAAPAGDPCHSSDRSDFLRDIFSFDILADSDLLAAALLTSARASFSSSAQPLDESSGQGFLHEQSASRGVVPNPPGPQSSADQVSMEKESQPVITATDPPVNPPADPPADPPVDPPADPSNDSLTNLPGTPSDRSTSSPIPSSSGRVCPSPSFSRCKTAAIPPALEALSRRPTRPTPPGKSIDVEEMQTQSSLKHKPVTTRKVADPKKGKH